MNHKQKIGYTLLGAFIMLIGMLIANLASPPVTAQSNSEITCKQLTFVDDKGQPLFTFNTTSGDTLVIRNKDGKKVLTLDRGIIQHQLTVYDTEEVENVQLGATKHIGGIVRVRNSDGKTTASMVNTEHGGVVYVANNDEKITAGMANTEHGGDLEVYDNDGNKSVSIDTTALGGSLILSDRDGNVAVAMSSDEHGGSIILGNRNEKPSATMSTTLYGGSVTVFNNQGEDRATMQVNRYGYGGVFTWDKNGYRQ